MEVEVATSSPFAFQNQIDLTDLWVHQPQWEAPTSSTADADSTYRPSIDVQNNNTKRKWDRAREIVLFPGERKQPVDLSNSNSGGVSSLVQKWRGFEKVAKSELPPLAPVTNDDDSIGDWESDRTLVSGRSSCSESERLRVADIIRRLTTEESGGSYSPPRGRTSWDHQTCLSPVVGSPRIRGRQAYIDILTQMERDRRNELQRLGGRKAVSQFSHRGRIQALLRIKFLRRGLGAIEGRFSNSTASKPPLATHLRGSAKAEKATDKSDSARSQHSATSKQDEIDHASSEANNCEVLYGNQHEASPLSKFIRQDSDVDRILAQYAEINSEQNKEDHQVSEPNYDTASDYANPLSYQEEEEVELKNNQQAVESDAYWVSDASHPEAGWEEVQSDYQEEGVGKGDWIGEVSRPRSDWEDLRQARYQEMLDPFSDNEEIRALLGRKSVSGFLSSGLREKIDQVMMFRCQTVTTNLQAPEEKHQQRTLPEQGVALEVAEKRDVREGYGDYFDEFEEAESSLGGQQYNESDYMEPSPAPSWPQNQGHGSDYMEPSPAPSWPQNQGHGSDYMEPSPAPSWAQNQGHGSDYMEPSPAPSWPQNQGHGSDYMEPSPAPSWAQNQGHGSDYLEPSPAPSWPENQVHESILYTPIQQSPSIGPTSSYGAHPPAIEMELIYDLRRHMEQLHQEMTELRKSINCCTDMQLKIQRSIKKEVTTALTTNPGQLSTDHTANGRRSNPMKKGVNGGRCCVCRKVQIDCVMYRCGHMCTCFKCAHDLQWSSGKCPVCRARIVDVVRTYSNY